MSEEKTNEFMESIGDKEKMKRQIETMAMKLASGKGTLKEMACITEEDMDQIYGMGYALYLNGKYEDAIKFFINLVMFDAENYYYNFGLASCMYMLGRYGSSSMYFLVCAGLDEQNPIPMFHIAECFMAQEDKSSAQKALKYCIVRAGDTSDFAEVKSQAEVMLQNIFKAEG